MCSGARGHSGALQCLPASCGNFACLQCAVLPGCKPHLALGRTQAASHEDDSTCFLLSKPPACVHQRWPRSWWEVRGLKASHPHPPSPKATIWGLALGCGHFWFSWAPASCPVPHAPLQPEGLCEVTSCRAAASAVEEAGQQRLRQQKQTRSN